MAKVTVPSDAFPRKPPAVLELARAAWRVRGILGATGLLELKQRYAGSALGSSWIVLYPLLFLSIYIFVYMMIFKVRFPGVSEFRYVVFVFSGLVPYLVLMESVTRSAHVIREHLHLVKNVIMPIELLPLRLVLVSCMGQTASLGFLIFLTILDGDLSWRVIFLPIVIVFFVMFILGIIYYVSALGAVFNDLGHIVGLLMTALMFLSPIAFKPDMVPAMLKAIVYVNPVSYPLEAFRWSFLADHDTDVVRLVAFPILATLLLTTGAAFFKRFKGMLADNV
jgi:lipopolysaccharide transport system permease protein